MNLNTLLENLRDLDIISNQVLSETVHKNGIMRNNLKEFTAKDTHLRKIHKRNQQSKDVIASASKN